MLSAHKLQLYALAAFKRATHIFNNTVHQPLIYDLLWYSFYAASLVAAPLLLLGLALLFIYDVLTGHLFLHRHIEPDGRAVLVTGCDSGFGLEIAKHMSEQGFKVYAACLTKAGVKQLEGLSELLIPVELNVLKQEHIDAVMDLIDRENSDGLYCMLNNAGVGMGSPVDWASMDHYDFVMGVNFFGVVRMCKSALPLLKRSVRAGKKARIVNVTSIAGLFGTLPFMSAYAASKHAAEAFSRSLRVEVEPLGIKVCILNPTFHATAMAHSTAQLTAVWKALPAEKQEEYGIEYFDEMLRSAQEGQSFPWEVQNVKRMMYHAIAGVTPREQYLVGLDAIYALGPLMCMPARIQYAVLWTLGRWWRLKPRIAMTNGQKAAVRGQ